MPHRTSLILDDETDRAARELALHFKCSSSEAIRRSVVRYRDLTLGVARPVRETRKRILRQLFELFADNDPEEEIARLKSEDVGF
jgi:hypothetical protein